MSREDRKILTDRHRSAAGGPRKWPHLHGILEAPRRLRAFVRAHETSLVGLAVMIGTIGGLVVLAMSVAVGGAPRAAVQHQHHRAAFQPAECRDVAGCAGSEPRRPAAGGGAAAVAALAAGARDRSDRGQRPARRTDVVSRQRHRRAADHLVRAGVGASVGLEAGYTHCERACGVARPRISPAPRRPAPHGRLRRGGRDRGSVRRSAGRRLLCVRTRDRRLYIRPA